MNSYQNIQTMPERMRYIIIISEFDIVVMWMLPLDNRLSIQPNILYNILFLLHRISWYGMMTR